MRKLKLPFVFNMQIPPELIAKARPPSTSSVDCWVQTEVSLHLQRVFYIRSYALPHTFYATCGSVLSHKGNISFLFLTENFKGCWLLPKHFQVQGNKAGWSLGTGHLPRALPLPFLVNYRHLTPIADALAALLLHSPVMRWEWHEAVWPHQASFFPTAKWV